MKKIVYILPFLLILFGAGCSNGTPKNLIKEQIDTIESNLSGVPIYATESHLAINQVSGEPSLDENVNMCKFAFSNDYLNCYDFMKKNSILENEYENEKIKNPATAPALVPRELSQEERQNYKNTIIDPRYELFGLECNDTIVACQNLLDFTKWEQNFVLYPELQPLTNKLNDLRDAVLHVGSYGMLRTNYPYYASDNLILTREIDFNLVNSVPIKIKTIEQELISIKQKYGIK